MKALRVISIAAFVAVVIFASAGTLYACGGGCGAGNGEEGSGTSQVPSSEID